MAKILILVVLAACSIGVESQSDAWTNVTRDVLIPYDLEAHPLHIRTDSEAGSKDKVRVQFYTSDGTWTTAIRLRFKNALEYQISSCTSDWTEFTTAIPDEQDKVWTITKGDAALTILCNDVEVLNYLYTDGVSGGSSALCEEKMGLDVEEMKFFSDDTASDAYMEQPDSGTTTYCNAPEIENGYVDPQLMAIAESQSYIVYCNAGFNINGDNTMLCMEDGSLSSAPTCTENSTSGSTNGSTDGTTGDVSESCWFQYEKTKYTGTILATVYSAEHVLAVCDRVNCVAYSCHANEKKGCNIYSEISGESPKWTSHVQRPCEV